MIVVVIVVIIATNIISAGKAPSIGPQIVGNLEVVTIIFLPFFDLVDTSFYYSNIFSFHLKI